MATRMATKKGGTAKACLRKEKRYRFCARAIIGSHRVTSVRLIAEVGPAAD